MNIELIIPVIAICLAALAALIAVTCLIQLKNYRAALTDANRQILQFESMLAERADDAEEISQKFSDHTRRLVWLEKRVRQPKAIDEEKLIDAAPAPRKTNITERRHRVLTLHSRGHDAETIAETLGMLHGEVELIINLNQTV